jgi:hypothetical protein
MSSKGASRHNSATRFLFWRSLGHPLQQGCTDSRVIESPNRSRTVQSSMIKAESWYGSNLAGMRPCEGSFRALMLYNVAEELDLEIFRASLGTGPPARKPDGRAASARSPRLPRAALRSLLCSAPSRSRCPPSCRLTGADLVSQYGGAITQIVRGEINPLSQAEEKELLGARMSYYPTDLLVVGWMTAII